MTESVSVVIPVYDGSRYLSEAIDSILEQTAPPDEIIVVDDGSSDGSIEPASRYPVRILTKEHGGIGPARNHGVRASSGELIAFLDSDDLWTPRKLELQTAALAAADVDIVFGHQEEFVSPDADPRPLRPPYPRGPGNSASLSLIRRPAFERVGPFTGRWVQGEWIDWWARARDEGIRAAVVPEVLVRRRLHERNHSRLQARARGEYAAILKESLDRRREPRA